MVITRAAILVNLGSPLSPRPKDVGRFLSQFLGDPRVVDAPRWYWPLLLNALIVPIRKYKSAEAYSSIWSEQGSPIRVISQQQVQVTQTALDKQVGENKIKVVGAETYGPESITKAISELMQQGINDIVVIPLYPQYSTTTTAPVYDQVADFCQKNIDLPTVKIIRNYYLRTDYIYALATSVRQHWKQYGKTEKLLMSFHGIPQEYVAKGDSYQAECQHTAQLLADELKLSSDEWIICFQSRFGPKKWLQPYTDKTLIQLALTGTESVTVISPAFAADCLETLEELSIENKELFIEHGGKDYSVVPCLNVSDEHIAVFTNLIAESFQ